VRTFVFRYETFDYIDGHSVEFVDGFNRLITADPLDEFQTLNVAVKGFAWP
jgi:hypothetical protein